MTAVLESPATDVVTATPYQQTFTHRQLPWIKLGAQIDHDVTAAEAAQLGGLDFAVGYRTLTYSFGGKKIQVPGRKAVVREDTGDFIDAVSDDYQMVQYADAFSFMDQINPRYVAAGTLSHGKQGFMVVQLPDLTDIDVEIGGVADPHDFYVILRTSHDRSKAIEIALMPLRGLCMNMLGLPSLTRGAPQRWSIKHVGDVDKKLAAAHSTLKRSQEYVKVFRNTARQLSSVKMNDEDTRYVLKMILPDRKRRDQQIDAIMAAYTGSPTVGFTGNGWGVVNAVSEYFQWGRNTATRTDQSMFTGGLTGDAAKYTGRATQLILARA